MGGGSGYHSLERVKDRLDVEYRRLVQRFEIADTYPQAVDCQDLDAMKSDRVGAVRSAGAEDAKDRPSRLISWNRNEHVTAGAVQPGKHDDAIADT
jgi:hypothetical protein